MERKRLRALMKVALFSKAFLPDTGGIETSSAMLARLWHRAGHDVRVVTKVPGPEIHEGVKVVRRWTPGALASAAGWADVVATNGYSRAVVAIAKVLRRPLVVLHQGYQLISSDGLGFRNRTFHGFDLRKDLGLAWQVSPLMAAKAVGMRVFDELFRRTATRVVHVVPSVHVRTRLNLPLAVVLYQPPNPAVVDAIKLQDWPEERREEAYRDGPVRFFGRLVFEKGVSDLVSAFALLRAEDWRTRGSAPLLEIFGEGPERPILEQLVRSNGMTDRVTFRGFLRGDELVLAARTASVVVIPSVWEEPGATIAVELFMAGAAVIASANGAPGEIFREHGRVFRNGDIEGLASTLRDHFLHGPRYPVAGSGRAWDLDRITRGSLEIIERAASMRRKDASRS